MLLLLLLPVCSKAHAGQLKTIGVKKLWHHDCQQRAEIAVVRKLITVGGVTQLIDPKVGFRPDGQEKTYLSHAFTSYSTPCFASQRSYLPSTSLVITNLPRFRDSPSVVRWWKDIKRDTIADTATQAGMQHTNQHKKGNHPLTESSSIIPSGPFPFT